MQWRNFNENIYIPVGLIVNELGYKRRKGKLATLVFRWGAIN